MKQAAATKIIVSILLCGTITWTACSTAWTTEAEQIIEALIPATANLITLVASLQENLPTAELQAIQSAGSQAGTELRLLQSLIHNSSSILPQVAPSMVKAQKKFRISSSMFN